MASWYRRAKAWSRDAWTTNAGYLAAGFGITTACLIVLVVLQAVEVHHRYPLTKWGTVPEAFAAVGTVGALWVAVLGWQHEVTKRRSDEQQRAEAEQRAQAELVTSWVDHYSEAHACMTIGLINASSGVIYDVEVDIVCETEFARAPQLRDVVPASAPGDQPGDPRRRAIAPWHAA
jgi:hypothetical protein